MRGKRIQDPIARVELGDKLRQARTHAGLRQEDAAAAIGISRTLLVAIERGQAPAEGDRLQQLAELYKRPIRYFQTSATGGDLTWGPNNLTPQLLAILTHLGVEDQYQVVRYAQFLRTTAAPPPAPGTGEG